MRGRVTLGYEHRCANQSWGLKPDERWEVSGGAITGVTVDVPAGGQLPSGYPVHLEVAPELGVLEAALSGTRRRLGLGVSNQEVGV